MQEGREMVRGRDGRQMAGGSQGGEGSGGDVGDRSGALGSTGGGSDRGRKRRFLRQKEMCTG